jgi:very-short-patch-repair endonuclease
MNVWRNDAGNWCRTCPTCGGIIEHGKDKNAKYYASHCHKQCKLCVSKGKNNSFYGKKHSEESKQKMSVSAIEERKYRYSTETRKVLSDGQIRRYSKIDERKKMSILMKKVMCRPDIRKKHLEALHRSKWIKVRTDKGQLEMIEKWNRLGFNFEPNYQIHTDQDLFYIDGYDKERNVILEYDGAYHQNYSQQQKDLVRQHTIINILKPKKFWRYIQYQNRFVEIIGDTHHAK